VYRAPEMLEDPHFKAREAIIEVDHPILGPFKMQNVFPKLSQTPGEVRWPGPEMGAFNAYVFKDILGYDDAKISSLKEGGVI
jgi:formyl-CoA transferase